MFDTDVYAHDIILKLEKSRKDKKDILFILSIRCYSIALSATITDDKNSS